MNILMVDVGGTNVKVLASHDGEMRRMPSGQTLTANEMVRGVLALTADLVGPRAESEAEVLGLGQVP